MCVASDLVIFDTVYTARNFDGSGRRRRYCCVYALLSLKNYLLALRVFSLQPAATPAEWFEWRARKWLKRKFRCLLSRGCRCVGMIYIHTYVGFLSMPKGHAHVLRIHISVVRGALCAIQTMKRVTSR